MHHQFEKQANDPVHYRYRIIPTGSADESAFGRVFDLDSKTHRLTAKVEPFKDGEVTRQSIVLWMQPLRLSEIVIFPDFAKMPINQLRALAEQNGVKLPKVEAKQADGKEQADLVAALKKHAASVTSKLAPVPKPKADVVVVSQDIMDLSDQEAETKATMMGLSVSAAPYKRDERHKIDVAIMRKMGQVSQI